MSVRTEDHEDDRGGTRNRSVSVRRRPFEEIKRQLGSCSLCFPSSPATPSVASIFLLSSYIRNPLSYGEAPSSHLHFRRGYTGANA